MNQMGKVSSLKESTNTNNKVYTLLAVALKLFNMSEIKETEIFLNPQAALRDQKRRRLFKYSRAS